jgi:CRISPR-associated protein Csd1
VLGVSAKEGFDAGKRLQSFRELHLSLLECTKDEGLVALKRFVENWTPERFVEMGFPEAMLDRNIVFRLESEHRFIHERPEAIDVWSRNYQPDTIGEGVCLITGDVGRIARLHPPLAGFDNPARIVSFDKDNDAFSSYGHVQAQNAPTSIEAAFAYSAVLNRYLKSDSGHFLQIGDASTVFWADATAAEARLAEAEALFGGFWDDAPNDAAPAIDESLQTRKIRDKLDQIRQGIPLASIDPGLAEGVRFHVLGLAPNAARLSIRFYFENSFGVIAANYQRYLADLRLEPPPRHGQPALWKYLAETAVLGKRDNIPPNLAGDWMRAILAGTRYPQTLLATVLMRLRADKDVNDLRVGILKALLIRNLNREDTPVALKPDYPSKGYQLGRLFAVYERIQADALGGKVNATIKDKFYGAASAQPRKVFALLEKTSANHLSKLGKLKPGLKVTREILVGEIMAAMDPAADPFPSALSAEDQALFGLGYHHQRSEFFKSTKDVTPSEETAP